MPRLVAVDATVDPAFVDRLRTVWDAGDAVLPVDPRLAADAQRRLLDDLRAGDSVTEGDALVVATSGTTGDPKGVVLTHAALRASAIATSTRLGVDPEVDSWLCCLPTAHVGGLSVVTRALATGTPLVVGGIDSEGATLVSLVAAQLRRCDPGRWRAILLGGGPAPADRPANAVATYGLTESGGGCVYDGEPLDGVEVRVDADGTLRLRGPMMLRAYRTADGEHDPVDPGGWFPTADAGHIGPDRRLHVLGRVDDVVVTGGEKVWPGPVEEVLRRVAGVAEAAIVGRPDPEWGERVVALIEVAPDHPVPTLDLLRAAVRDVLPAWCAPKELEVVDSLPRTALGKVRRSALRPGKSPI